ncbi:MAG: FKBP-type peptidyl-prolyl cis-trans isomerase [Verrucomicrobia bacterium]|nr:FKBP-type peptidyl-prolyl cis-trans isomerase [Verrucomicrobiota bacterium]
MRNFLYLLLLGVILGTIAIVVRSGLLARKNPGVPINSTMRQSLAEETPELSESDATLIRSRYANAHRLRSGLLYVERAPGTGNEVAREGHEIVVHYDGRLLDGTPFDSSYKSGVPLTFRIGAGQVIKGWDEGFLGMKRGEKRTLVIPYWLAYGVRGNPPSIPPQATLVFDVEVLDVR